MTEQLAAACLKASIVLVTFVVSGVAAQERESRPVTRLGPDTKVKDSSKPEVKAQASSGQTAQKPIAKHPATSGVRDVLMMMDAGVSKEVIKAYVENAPIIGDADGTDLIALKEHRVPDDITIALLKRAAERRRQNSPATSTPSVATYSVSIDPDSYDYFQNYYLYPRTLGYAYERLGGYPAPYPGYYGAFGPRR
jgi:hypothetical protein